MTTTVLVVEDDLEINELIGEYLALENIKYLSAPTGQAGIHIATAQHPDAIILDLMLPDIDGFEVARTLANRRGTYDIPIIILSCMCQECDRQKGFANGALFFMNKPFLPDDLLATLRQAVEWKQNLKKRMPSGEILLGGTETSTCRKSVNQMIADIYVRTELTDQAVGHIHEAIDMLDAWAGQWATNHPKASKLKIEYHISANAAALNGNAPPLIEWKLTEEAPGFLADAFFKAAPPAGGLIGWGANNKAASAPLPQAQWNQILAKTGADIFERDARARSIRFWRHATLSTSGVMNAAAVPVVDSDGARAVPRPNVEMLAGRQK